MHHPNAGITLVCDLVPIDVVLDELAKVLAKKKPEMLTVNKAAIDRGRQILREKAEAGQFAVR